MKLKQALIAVVGLFSSDLALAHGIHAFSLVDETLHLLAHNWPLLLVGIAVGLGWLLRSN